MRPAKGHEAPLPLHLGSPQAVIFYAYLPFPISERFASHRRHSKCSHIWSPLEQRWSQTIWAPSHGGQGSVADPFWYSMNQAPARSRTPAGFDPTQCNMVSWSSHSPAYYYHTCCCFRTTIPIPPFSFSSKTDRTQILSFYQFLVLGNWEMSN